MTDLMPLKTARAIGQRSIRARSAQSSPPQAVAAAGPANLGQHIRDLRQDRGWSLADLTRRTNIATSTLSKVENGALSLNYERLQIVASGFDLSLSEFLAPPNAQPADAGLARVSWGNKANAERVDAQPYDYFYLCTDLRRKQMVPILSRVKARTLKQFGPMLRHAGEEFVFVVKGLVEVHTEHYAPRKLEAGEGVYIDSRQHHAYLAASEEETWILSVNSEFPQV